jgi:hypothetical protein
MTPKRPTRIQSDMIATVMVVGLLVPLMAAVGALMGPYVSVAFIALIAAALSFAIPTNLLVLGCFLAGSLLAGMLEYFAGITQAYWLPYLMGALLVGRALIANARPHPRIAGETARTSRKRVGALHLITWMAIAYIAVVLFGSLMALPPLLQVIVAAKNYFFLWGVLLILVCGHSKESDSFNFWTTVAVVACIQWPVVIYQRYVVAAGRRDAAAWDAAVGTFGGNPESGGHSPGMAFVCCLAVAIIVSRMRDKKLGTLSGILFIVLSVIPLALAEVKAAFVWLALIFLIFFAKQVTTQPFRAISTLVIGASLLGGLGLIYKTTYQAAGGGSTIQEVYDRQIRYTFDPDEYRSDLKRLGRMTAIVYWWQRHDLAQDPIGMLFGHGIGASRSSSSLAVGELARKLPVPVDINAASTLLWDVGLLGAMAFAALLAVAAIAALRLSKNTDLSATWRESALLSTCVLVIALSSLLYNRDAIDDVVVQTLLYFAIGQTLLARRALIAVRAQKTEDAKNGLRQPPSIIRPMAHPH